MPRKKKSTVYSTPRSRVPIVEEPSIAFTSRPFLAFMDRFGILSLIERQRDSRSLIKELINQTGLSIGFLAENVFEVTPKTLAQYRDHKTALPTRSAEICAELTHLYILGISLFGTKADFNQWLMLPSYGLNDRIPATLLNSSTGIGLIYEELKKIEFGATA